MPSEIPYLGDYKEDFHTHDGNGGDGYPYTKQGRQEKLNGRDWQNLRGDQISGEAGPSPSPSDRRQGRYISCFLSEVGQHLGSVVAGKPHPSRRGCHLNWSGPAYSIRRRAIEEIF